ncbi:MAG: sialate O-acetylesterase, partial [Gemmataceae bacterium]|nr:sialate O-acetylesterase [Gemmataceae bacterium]
YNGMIAPLLPFAIKGVIWYQGESNVGNAWQYRTLFPAMIKNWRDDWKQGDFPFLFVQIAAFKPYNSERSPVLREAQLYTAQTVPNSAMVVITDYGDEGDIHPVDKDPVGVRLALCAQALAYKEKVPHSGPEFTRQKIEGTKIVLSFKNADVLVAKELEIPRTLAELGEKNGKKVVLKRYQSPIQVKAGELPGFTIAGKDGKFFEAQAKIIGGQIEVSSAQVSEPVAVRYGWSDSPVINLFNGAGLPASPFRTDVFKVPSQP